MSWLRNRNNEGKESEKPEVKPRNQILQTPETVSSDAKKKLDSGSGSDFRERYKFRPVEPTKPEKEKITKPSTENPYKEERIRER